MILLNIFWTGRKVNQYKIQVKLNEINHCCGHSVCLAVLFLSTDMMFPQQLQRRSHFQCERLFCVCKGILYQRIPSNLELNVDLYPVKKYVIMIKFHTTYSYSILLKSNIEIGSKWSEDIG